MRKASLLNYRKTVSAVRSGWSFRVYLVPAVLCPRRQTFFGQFNRTVRHEWLSPYLWRDLDEVSDFATDWIWKYNSERPNMALNGITPMQQLAMAA